MSVIHTYYRSFHIYWRNDQRAYHVTHDKQPETCDEHLHHHSLNAAKRYVDVCCDILYGFIMDPHKSMMLLPFYRCGYRSDGPLPAGMQLVVAERAPSAQHCQHVWCNVNHRNMTGGNLWQYCAAPVHPGSTRCIQHSR